MKAKTQFRLILAAVAVFLSGLLGVTGQGMVVGITNTVWSYSADNSDQYAAGFPNVDVSGWPTGRGLFGNDVLGGYPYPFATPIQSSSTGIQTAYFQTAFVWNGSPAGVSWALTNYVDDGVVIYLNGVEITRWNLPGAFGTPVSHETLAVGANPGGEPVRVVHRVVLDALTNGNANPLRTGSNVLAASVHQSGTASSDSVFGLSIGVLGEEFLCGTISPSASTVDQCRDVQFVVSVPPTCQAPLSIAWFHDGVQIPGASGERLALRNVQPGVDDGLYHVRLYGLVGAVDTSPVTLSVTPDASGPGIVRVAAVFGAPDQWRVTFDEPVDPGGGAGDPLTYHFWSGSDPRWFSTVSATIEAGGRSALLVTDVARLPGVWYEYRTIQSIEDACRANETLHGLGGWVWNADAILDYTDFQTWRYSDEGIDYGTAWRDVGFDDANWKTGQQLFHADRVNLSGTVVAGLPVRTFVALTNVAVNPPANLPTAYFRLPLYVPYHARALVAYPVFDDGIIVYIDGVEIHRTNVSATAEAWANYSGGASIEAGAPGFSGGFEIPLASVKRGQFNTLAVMLKQVNGTSGDLTFGLRVVAEYLGHGEGLPPVVAVQPADVVASEGHRLTLQAEAVGVQVSYQWYREGVPIPEANSPSYQRVVQPGDAGEYWVRVSNPWGEVDSRRASVTVRPVVVSYGHLWRYSTNSQDATLSALPWYGAAFDDSGWAMGPGPFARETSPGTLARFPAPAATPLPLPNLDFLTAYFRTVIEVPPVPAGSALVLTHLVDDGAVIYVDGVPALSHNAPPHRPILAGDLSPGVAPGDGDAVMVPVPMAMSPGLHTIAVEVHQASASSADVVFGAEWRILEGAPALSVERVGASGVVLRWPDHPSYSLNSATGPGGPFTPVAGDPRGTHGFSVDPSVGGRFFQLRFNGR